MKSNNVLVSVALATYNGAKYIEKQLDSVLNQTYPIDEIIIVDDCSSDNTVDIIKAYQRFNSKIKLFVNERNLRSNLSFNKAISLTSGDLIAFCDQDDIWDKNKIEVQVTELSKHNFNSDKPLLIYHDLRLMNNEEIIMNDSFWKLHKFTPLRFNYNNLFLFNVVTGCTCIINKPMKEEMMKCDMKNIIMHDYLLALIGYGFGNVICIDKPLMSYRSHSNSVTTKEKINFANRVMSFIQRSTSNEYLMPNLLQIQKFLLLYGKLLSAKYLKDSEEFVTLIDKNVINRICYKWFN